MRKLNSMVLALVSAGLMTTSFSSSANKLPYTFVDASYVMASSDEDEDPDGFRFNGSLQFLDKFFLLGSYQMLSSDITIGPATVTTDFTTLRLGGGMRFPVSPDADLVGSITYDDYTIDVDTPLGSGTGDADGYTFTGGARMQLDKIELMGNFIYSVYNADDAADDDDNDTGFELGARFNIAPNIWLGYTFTTMNDDETDTHAFTARFAFKGM